MRYLFLLLILVLIRFSLYSQDGTCNDQWFEGEGTFYGGVSGGMGNCSIPVSLADTLHAAMNNIQYEGSSACGACARILGPKGEVIVKIVDRCPECKHGDIDMTMQAFKLLANQSDGRIKIRWQYVPCPINGNIVVKYKEGSSQYWSAFQFRNLKYPLINLECRKKDGSYQSIERSMDNYFIHPTGVDEDKSHAGPYTFRLTESTGRNLILEDIPFISGGETSSDASFPLQECKDCAGVLNGEANIDNCGKCAGGTTGLTPNESCQKDCIGYWEGTAYVDDCGVCVSGTTGRTPCGPDCNGALGGLAYTDNCGECVGGNTGKAACRKDCRGEWGGLGFLDACGICRSPDEEYNDSDCITAVRPGLHSPSITIYPNPCKDMFIVDGIDNFLMKIYNASGSLINTYSNSNNEIHLDGKEGIYYIQIIRENFIKGFVLIKQ